MRIPSRVYESLMAELRDSETIRSMLIFNLSMLLGVLFILGVIVVQAVQTSGGSQSPPLWLSVFTGIHAILLLLLIPLVRFVRKLVWSRMGSIKRKDAALEAVRSGLLATVAIGEGLAFLGSVIVLVALVNYDMNSAHWLWANLISPVGFILYQLTHLPTTERLQRYVQTHFSRV